MSAQQQNNDAYQLGNAFVFVYSTQTLYCEKQTISLNRAEREVLTYLIQNHHRVVPFDELIKAGWPHKSVSRTSLIQTIRNLRIKLRETTKGEIFETVANLGYQVKAKPTDEHPITEADNPQSQADKSDKLSHNKKLFACGFALVIAAFTAFIFFSYLQEPSYHYQTVYDDDNNTIVYFSESKESVYFLKKYANTYITPTKLNNRFFFIGKYQNYYSVAFCDKNEQNQCDPATARSITFYYKDVEFFWRELAKNANSNINMALMRNQENVKNTGKAYNQYIDEGRFISNINQLYLQKDEGNSWNFTLVNYRKFKPNKRFVPLTFTGGEMLLNSTQQAPFIAEAVLAPHCIHSILPLKEIERRSDGPAGKLERNLNKAFEGKDKVHFMMLYRQNGLILWFNKLHGLSWFHQDNIVDSEFRLLIDFDSDKDYLHLESLKHN